MKRVVLSTAVLVWVIASASVSRTDAEAPASPAQASPAPAPVKQSGPAPTVAPSDPHQALLSTYCYTCHNARAKVGGLVLQGLDIQAVSGDAETWTASRRS